jgi:putative transcriptional regulator
MLAAMRVPALLLLCVAAWGNTAIPTGPEKPATGMLLVASKALADPNFRRTVVLLLDHGPDGALGVVINRPTSLTLGEVLPAASGFPAAAETIYLGGPVALDQLRMLLRSEHEPPDAARVLPGIYLGTVIPTLRWQSQPAGHQALLKPVLGYAGWGSGQLESEIARGDWLLTDGSPMRVFDPQSERLWQQLEPVLSGLRVDASRAPQEAS